MKRPTELEIREKIREFAKKKCGTIGHHNMYYIFSEDMDGNVTGEAYGINSFTDYGMQHMYVNGQTTVTTSYYYGNVGTYFAKFEFGTEWPDPTPENPNAGTPLDPNFGSMYNAVFSVSKSNTGSWGDYNYYQPTDLIFDGTFLTGIDKIDSMTTEYNYSGITSDIQIKEIGIYPKAYNGYNNMSLHSRILDENGDPSFILKRINEKLTVYVYGAYNVPVSIMKDAYDAGWNGQNWNPYDATFIFINPQGLFYSGNMNCYYATTTSDVSSEMYHNMSQAGNNTTVSNEISTNHQVKHHTTFTDKLLENKHELIDRIYGLHSLSTDNFKYSRRTITFVKLLRQAAADADTIENDLVTCNNSSSSWWTDNQNLNLSDSFSKPYSETYHQGEVYSTNFTLNALKMFDISTKSFNIIEQFSSDDNFYLCLTLNFFGYVYMKWPDNSYYHTAVFMNPNPKYAITHFENTDVTIMYASDAWWDTSTWISIDDLQNVSASNGKKRYFIIRYGQTSTLLPRYNEEPKIIPMTQYKDLGVSLNTQNDNYYSNERTVANDVDHFIIGKDQIICLDSNKDHVVTHTVSGYNNGYVSPKHRYFYGTKVCLLNNSREEASYGSYWSDNRGARIYDLSDPNAPTYVDIQVDTNSNITSGTSTYIHHQGPCMNDKPYVVFWDKTLNGNNKQCVQILDFSQTNQADMVEEIEDATHPYIIGNSNLLLYRNNSITDHLSFNIYDMANKTVVHTFQLSDAYFGTLLGCMAFSTDGSLNNSFIYLTIQLSDNSYVTYRYDSSTQVTTVTNCYDNIYTWTNISVENFAMKDCGLVHNGTNVVLYNPTDPDITKTFTVNNSQQSFNVRYINNNKQLVVGGECYRNSGTWYTYLVPFDLGLLLNTDENIFSSTDWFPRNDNYSTDVMIPYDKGMIVSKETNTSSKQLVYIPIERFIPHYVNLTTRNIQSYNNPIRVQGVELEDCFTNIVDRTQPV